MAPTASVISLAKRYYCDSYYDNCNSGWSSWGRWVALAVIVIAVLLLAFLFSCYNTRRRRQRGQTPMYGTGWMPGHKPPGTQPGYYNNGAAAPPYSPPVDNQYTGNTFNSNEGYYGNAYNNGYGAQQGGIELQQPQHSYQPRGGDSVYEAPQGPPPGKGDGIIR